MTSGRQRRAAVEHADVVEAEEAALEYVLAEAVLAVHPPGEVQQELVEGGLQEVDVHFVSQGLLGAMQEQRRKGVDGRVHVAEVPLVRGHLAVRVLVGAAQHQTHLILGEVGVGNRERERVEGEVPRGVPRVLPLVWHRNDVLVEHVEPFRVARVPIAGVERVGAVFIQPVVAVEKEELLAPQHPGNGLAHHVGGVWTCGRRRDRLVELVGFTTPLIEECVERCAERLAALAQRAAREPKANLRGLSGADRDAVVRRDFGALSVWD